MTRRGSTSIDSISFAVLGRHSSDVIDESQSRVGVNDYSQPTDCWSAV